MTKRNAPLSGEPEPPETVPETSCEAQEAYSAPYRIPGRHLDVEPIEPIELIEPRSKRVLSRPGFTVAHNFTPTCVIPLITFPTLGAILAATGEYGIVPFAFFVQIVLAVLSEAGRSRCSDIAVRYDAIEELYGRKRRWPLADVVGVELRRVGLDRTCDVLLYFANGDSARCAAKSADAERLLEALGEAIVKEAPIRVGPWRPERRPFVHDAILVIVAAFTVNLLFGRAPLWGALYGSLAGLGWVALSWWSRARWSNVAVDVEPHAAGLFDAHGTRLEPRRAPAKFVRWLRAIESRPAPLPASESIQDVCEKNRALLLQRRRRRPDRR